MKAKVDSAFFNESTFTNEASAWASSFCADFASAIPQKADKPVIDKADQEIRRFAKVDLAM